MLLVKSNRHGATERIKSTVQGTPSIPAQELERCGLYLKQIGAHAAQLGPNNDFGIYASLTFQPRKCNGVIKGPLCNI